MSDEIEYTQSEEQEIAQRAQQLIEQARNEVQSKRAEGKFQELKAAYVAEMTKPQNRGKGHVLKAIKEKYQKLGLDTGRVDFTGSV